MTNKEDAMLDDAALDSLDNLARKAIPGPWRNLRDEWNAALDDYYKRRRKHWHGSLRGARHKRSAKHCAALIVRDSFQGEPINLANWNGYPDYWDLKRVIADPDDLLFPSRKRTFVMADGALWGSDGESKATADFIAAANPQTVQALIAELRAERAKNRGVS